VVNPTGAPRLEILRPGTEHDWTADSGGGGMKVSE